MAKKRCCYYCRKLRKCSNENRIGKLLTFACKDFASIPVVQPKIKKYHY